MTNVQISGLMAAHRKNRRSQVEREFYQRNELQTISHIKEDKSGRCYTYRGVEYCYN